MSPKIIQITSQIIEVRYRTQDELARAFIRFQEHYEGPKYRGTIFTLGEYRAWYAQHNGAFNYYTEWTGFNIPSYVFANFKHGLFDPLLPEEQELLDLFIDRRDKFYVIGTYREKEKTHETAHALFYLDNLYREKVVDLVRKYNRVRELAVFIRSEGYHKDVLIDEIQAYIIGDNDWLHKKQHGVPESLRKTLHDIFILHLALAKGATSES
jgi:hypothetical protein